MPGRAVSLVVMVLAAVTLALMTRDGTALGASSEPAVERPSRVGSSTTTTTAPAPTSTTAAPSSVLPTTVPPAAVAPATTLPPVTAPPAPPPPPPPPSPPVALCLGDSVMLGAGPPYQNTLSMCGAVDAVESRQFHEADDVAAFHAAAAAAQGAALPPVVIVHLGTNGYTTAGEIDALLANLPGVSRVVLVTVQLQHARAWQDAVNAELRAAAARYPGLVAIADWEAASAGHPEWFGPDGIHITSSPAGAQAYAATIDATVAAAP